MHIPIDVDGFEGRGLKLRTASLFSWPKLVVDGQLAKGRRMRYMLRDNQGNNVQARIMFNGLDPVPRIEIGGRVFQLARPLQWYEYAWIGLPAILVVGGGMLGSLFGLAAVYSSARIFRSERAPLLKYLVTGAISVGALLAFVVIAVMINLLAEVVIRR